MLEPPGGGDPPRRRAARDVALRAHAAQGQAARERCPDRRGAERPHHLQERWFGFDDALYAGARLLEVLSLDPGPPRRSSRPCPAPISTPELGVPLDEGEPERVMQSVVRWPASSRGFELILIDGLRAEFESGLGAGARLQHPAQANLPLRRGRSGGPRGDPVAVSGDSWSGPPRGWSCRSRGTDPRPPSSGEPLTRIAYPIPNRYLHPTGIPRCHCRANVPRPSPTS
jgi:hypothetical protein